MNKYSHLLKLILLFSIFSYNVSGQNLNTYKFIEPNISVSYDSNFFKVAQRYSSTFYETEAYDFKYQIDTANRVTIHIKADQAAEHPLMSVVDNQMLFRLKELKKVDTDSFKVVSIDESPRHIQGFSLVGFVGYDKINKQYGTMISGFRLSDSDKTEIRYSSSNRNDLEKDYEILKTFLSRFKAYSKQEVAKEDAEIKSNYSVIVNPTKTVIGNFKYRRKTYLGIVAVKQSLRHQVAEVRLTSSLGQEIFTPNEKGQVAIICFDDKKGTVVKEGELVLLNSFGKKVKLPFTFSYVNEGAW